MVLDHYILQTALAHKNIFKRHWSKLKNYRVLGSLLPDKPAVVFRGLRSSQARIAPHVIDHLKRPVFFHALVGYYPCQNVQSVKSKLKVAEKGKQLDNLSAVQLKI